MGKDVNDHLFWPFIAVFNHVDFLQKFWEKETKTVVFDSLHTSDIVTVTIDRMHGPVRRHWNTSLALTIVCVISIFVFYIKNCCRCPLIHCVERSPDAPPGVGWKTVSATICAGFRVQRCWLVIEQSTLWKLYGIQSVYFHYLRLRLIIVCRRRTNFVSLKTTVGVPVNSLSISLLLSNARIGMPVPLTA